jgi:hypothetical protein
MLCINLLHSIPKGERKGKTKCTPTAFTAEQKNNKRRKDAWGAGAAWEGKLKRHVGR